MPSTQYPSNPPLLVYAIQARTTAAGAAAVDASGSDLRTVAELFTPGVRSNNFNASVAGMVITVGSAADLLNVAVLRGTAQGQGSYVIGQPGAFAITAVTAHPTQARVDEIYLMVADAAYDAGSLALPRYGYRVGDAGGGAPGPDAAWKAHLLLYRVNVPAAASAVTLSDQRTYTSPGVHAHAGSDISSGSIPVAQIPPLPASVITSGEFAAARIPTLDAAKIGSGTLDPARIPTLDAAKIGSGTFHVDRIPGLDAAKITGGTLAIARIPTGTGSTQVALGNHTHAYISSTTPRNVVGNSFNAYRVRNVYIGATTPPSTDRETGDIWFET